MVQIPLHFNNPITKKKEVLTVRQSQLDDLRNNRSHNGLVIISFFHTEEDKNYTINLHLDAENKVRLISVGRFFLKANGKLFR